MHLEDKGNIDFGYDQKAAARLFVSEQKTLVAEGTIKRVDTFHPLIALEPEARTTPRLLPRPS